MILKVIALYVYVCVCFIFLYTYVCSVCTHVMYVCVPVYTRGCAICMWISEHHRYVVYTHLYAYRNRPYYSCASLKPNSSTVYRELWLKHKTDCNVEGRVKEEYRQHGVVLVYHNKVCPYCAHKIFAAWIFAVFTDNQKFSAQNFITKYIIY